MLIDIEFNQEKIDECNNRLRQCYSEEECKELEVKGSEDFCHRVQQGIYYTGLNFNHEISMFSNQEIKDQFDSFSFVKYKEDGKVDWDYYQECVEAGMEYKSNYGVCDNFEQVLGKYPELKNKDRKFVLSLAKITKKSQPEDGGWRWEKWGEYIGSQKPQAYYLYDEPEIEYVCCYHIYEIK